MARANSSDLRLPDLRFVPVVALVPHEQPDEQRLEPLVKRFREQAVLRNPPVVAPLAGAGEANARYMVLDGANRSSAARAAGLPHMVVQVVRYDDPGVQLLTWYHALDDSPRPGLEGELTRIPGLTIRPDRRLHAQAALARREALACVVFLDVAVATLHGVEELVALHQIAAAVVDCYRSRGRFHRVTGDSIEEARARHPEVTALVLFPHSEPAEIIELATSGARLPAGISRHVIPWRALRVNVPLERLSDPATPLEEKNRWLAGWLKEKLTQRQVRFYQEPTVLFDE